MTLSEVVGHYNNLRGRAREKGVDLELAMSFFETRYRPETESITILNAKAEFMSNRQDISKATRSNYDLGLALLLKPYPNKFFHSFTVADIEKPLKKYPNTRSKRSFRIIFSVFFRWAVRHHYCLENPCDRLDKLPKDMSQIAALSLEESKRLLYAATQLQEGAAAAVVAIGMFAGLRPSEIRDLTPEDILKDRIRVSGGKMRRKHNRTAPIPPVLAAWLEKYPFEGLPKGWSYKRKALKKATKAKNWVQDIIRHTSLSFQAERDKNEALTAFNCGTSIQMMNRHYRHSIDDEKIIDEFWNLTPAKLMAKKPEIELPGKPKIKWPSIAALKKLVWEKPLIHAAKEVGVSDVALRKHCVKLGIELPKQGHWVRQQQLSARR
jgi:integrase